MKIKAYNDWIVILKKKKNKRTKIILNIKEYSQRGIVVSVGKNIKDIKLNDCVIYKKYSENKVKIDNKKYIFIKYKNILAKII
ncbi:co-chaperone GroES [Candidatus Vidania fulgoroideorum]